MKGMEGDAISNKNITVLSYIIMLEKITQQSSGSQTPELQGNKEKTLVQFK